MKIAVGKHPGSMVSHLDYMMKRRWWLWVVLWVMGTVGQLLGAPHGSREVDASPRRAVVGYFPQWGVYSDPRFLVKTLVTNGDAGLLDQVNYAQGSVAGGRCSVADANADLNVAFKAEESVDGRADADGFRGNFHQIEELKRRYPKLKVLISLEGKAANFAEDALPENRERFVASCVDLFVRGNFGAGVRRPELFDGIDLDWEYPREGDAANFLALLKEMRRQMDAVRPGLRLTVAVGPSLRMYPGTDMAAVAKLVDQIGVMNYDYNGPWNGTTGFLAPLMGDPTEDHGGTVERSIAAYREAGAPTSKLLMGMPFYGYGWSGVGRENHGLYQDGKGIRGDRPYWYIESLGQGFEHYRDERSGAPWMYDGKTLWTYEDPVSADKKGRYARQQALGGVMIWELSGDTVDGELLKAVRRGVDGVEAVRSGGGRARR